MLIPCPLCGSGEPTVAGVCPSCAETIVEAYQGQATDGEFEAWWALYPRKVGKDAARQKYQKARKRASADELTQALQAYVDASAGKDKEFIVHPSTWLHQGRWMDERETPMRVLDMDEKHVRDFIDKGFWLPSWGPKPNEDGAPARVRHLYDSLAPGCRRFSNGAYGEAS